MKKTILLAATMLLSYAANAITLPTWKEGEVYLVKVKKDFYPENYGLTPGALSYGASFDKEVLREKATKAGMPHTTDAQLSQFLLDVSVEEFVPINANSIGDDKGTMYFYEGDLSRYFFIEARTDTYQNFPKDNEASVNPYKTTGGLATTNFFEWGCECKIRTESFVFGTVETQMVGTEYWQQHFEQKGVMAGAYNHMAIGETLELDHDCANSALRAHYVHLSNPTKNADGTWTDATDMKNVQTYFYSPKTVSFGGGYGNSITSSPKGIIGIVSATLKGEGVDKTETSYTHKFDFTSSMGELVESSPKTYTLYKINSDGTKSIVYSGSNNSFSYDIEKTTESQNITYQLIVTSKTESGIELSAKSNIINLPVPSKTVNKYVAASVDVNSKANDTNMTNTVTNTVKWNVSDNIADKEIITYERIGTNLTFDNSVNLPYLQLRYDYWRVDNIRYEIYEEGSSTPIKTVAHVNGTTEYSQALDPTDYNYGALDPNKVYTVKAVVTKTKCSATGKAYQVSEGVFKNVYDGSIVREQQIVGVAPIVESMDSNKAKAEFFTPEATATNVSYNADSTPVIFTDDVTLKVDNSNSVSYYEVYSADMKQVVARATNTVDNPTITTNVEGEFTNGSKTNKYFGHVVTLNGSTWGCGPATATHTEQAVTIEKPVLSTKPGNSVDSSTNGPSITFGTEYETTMPTISLSDYTQQSYITVMDSNGDVVANINIDNASTHDPERIIYNEDIANKESLTAKVVIILTAPGKDDITVESDEVAFITTPVAFESNYVELSNPTNYGNSKISAELNLKNAVNLTTDDYDNDYMSAIVGYQVDATYEGQSVLVGADGEAAEHNSTVISNDSDNLDAMNINIAGGDVIFPLSGFTVNVNVTPLYNVTTVESPMHEKSMVAGVGNMAETYSTDTMTKPIKFGMPLAVDTIDAAQASVTGGYGAITISGSNAEAKVFDFNGKLIYKGFDRTINCEAGIYVVALSDNTYKVVVF